MGLNGETETLARKRVEGEGICEWFLGRFRIFTLVTWHFTFTSCETHYFTTILSWKCKGHFRLLTFDILIINLVS